MFFKKDFGFPRNFFGYVSAVVLSIKRSKSENICSTCQKLGKTEFSIIIVSELNSWLQENAWRILSTNESHIRDWAKFDMNIKNCNIFFIKLFYIK